MNIPAIYSSVSFTFVGLDIEKYIWVILFGTQEFKNTKEYILFFYSDCAFVQATPVEIAGRHNDRRCHGQSHVLFLAPGPGVTFLPEDDPPFVVASTDFDRLAGQ
jgi:hypothetical protein